MSSTAKQIIHLTQLALVVTSFASAPRSYYLSQQIDFKLLLQFTRQTSLFEPGWCYTCKSGGWSTLQIISFISVHRGWEPGLSTAKIGQRRNGTFRMLLSPELSSDLLAFSFPFTTHNYKVQKWKTTTYSLIQTQQSILRNFAYPKLLTVTDCSVFARLVWLKP